MRRILILMAVVLALVGARAATAAPLSLPTSQLPRTVRPLSYSILIAPDAKDLRFTGKAGISLELLEPTDSITLNALGLNFDSVTLRPVSGRINFAAQHIVPHEAEQSVTFSFGKVFPRGRYLLQLDYNGRIATQAAGLFAVDYEMADGPKRALYTQFENSDARRMIPSWDEPGYRTSFTLEIIVPAGQLAVSNMPIEKTTVLADGQSLVRFAPTPKMSTYLLFLGAGEFERRTQKLGNTELGVITKTGAGAQAAFALESSAAVLNEYNDYFGISYPLPKLDNIAAPGHSQFFSAMENWGAIFSFEYSILLDPAISSVSDKQRAFQVAAHEIGHQWFGNLVTMHWWDDLWLNEGFASWMESRVTARLHPEWQTALAAVDVREAAMSRDALASTHPVVQHINSVQQASLAFDDITYGKGQAIVHMLENYVGAEAWRNGVRQYMKKHAYGNTVSDDLWRQIEAAAGQPVTAIAHDFTLQAGVPLIRVAAPVCVDGRTTLQLTQAEFSKDQPDKAAQSWRVPVVAQAIGAREQVRTLVGDGRATLSLAGCAPVLVNAGQGGYYRTLYSQDHFRALAQNFSALAPIDQLGILTDSWSLGLAGLQSPTDFLDLVRAMPAATDPKIWGKIAGALVMVDALYKESGASRSAYRKFAIGRLAPVLARVGWRAQADEPDASAILRNELIGALAALGDTNVIAETRRLYDLQMMDPDAIPGDLRTSVMRVVAQHADSATWQRLYAEAQAEKTSLIKDQLYDFLASTREQTLARKALDLALTNEPGETGGAAMISRVAKSHPDLAFDFALANMAALSKKIDAASSSRYFPMLANGSTDPAMIEKVNAYATTYLPASARGEAATVAANIAFWLKLRDQRLPLIDAWVATN